MGLYNMLKNWRIKSFAIMKNDDGDTLDKVRFKLEQDYFKYKNKAYNIKRKHVFRETISGWFSTTQLYFYNIKHPNPLDFSIDSSKLQPEINPELYNTLLEARVLIELNKLVKKDLFGNISMQNMLYVVGAIMIVIYIYAKGGF